MNPHEAAKVLNSHPEGFTFDGFKYDGARVKRGMLQLGLKTNRLLMRPGHHWQWRNCFGPWDAFKTLTGEPIKFPGV